MKTFIRWEGNKSKYIKNIIKYFPKSFTTYIEPFVGSGALFLKLQPQQWIINDVNTDLHNVWTNVKKSPNRIQLYFKKFGIDFIPLSKEDKLVYCQQLVQKLNHLRVGVKRSAIYLLMKYCAYMGHIISQNKYKIYGLDGPLYKNKSIYFLSDKYFNNLVNISEYLNKSNGLILNKDYKEILKVAKKNDFVFIDPPYIEEHNYKFNYNKGEIIDTKFLDELYMELSKLNSRNVKWLMTQADTDIIREKFNKYTIIPYQVYRIRSGNYKNELIIKNY